MRGATAGKGMGWVPDYPDIRDFTIDNAEIQPMAKGSKLLRSARTRPPGVDLRKWCSPIEDQGEIGSCTAQAATGLVEYFERRATGKHLDASRLFLYKVTRNLRKWTGDTGAEVRTALQALVLFGVPPEEYWPYHEGKYDDEPPSFCYAFAQNFRTIRYFRLDPHGTSRAELLSRIRLNLAHDFPCAFGFTVYSSIADANGSGEIPFPQPKEKVEGGHAVMAVGYDDNKRVGRNKGALLIRNSWGVTWGERGYGWLPYAYVEAGLAEDFWTVLKQDWIDTGRFS